jgi:hypothetical protein
MSNKFTRFLTGVGSGIINPKGLVNNWEHATYVFVNDTYRLAPRTKFLFHVTFEIDHTAHKATAFKEQQTQEISLLVKSADLPKFTFDSVVKNQYNRKKLVYKQINYDPVTLTFHDDNNGIVNALWAIYYGYYIADRHNPTAAWEANHLRPTKTPKDNFRYGMDNEISVPLFKSITIHTMSRRRFLGYTLVNPRIKTWNHGNVAYSDGGTVESTMTLEYEAVRYSAGTVRTNSPKGFASLHYDNVPSPLSVAGGGTATVTGEGGVLDGLEQIFGDLTKESTFNTFGGFLGTAIKTINTYKNVQGLSKESIKGEVINILSNPASIATAVSTVGGVIGAVFPKSSTNTDVTPATQKNLIGNNAQGGETV